MIEYVIVRKYRQDKNNNVILNQSEFNNAVILFSSLGYNIEIEMDENNRVIMGVW